MKKLLVKGQMDGSFESVNRVYERKLVSPAIQTCDGGDRQPKSIRKYEIISKTSNKRRMD